MFIYSIRASTVKFFGFIALTLLLIVGATLLGPGQTASAAAGEVTDFSGIKTKEDRIAFIESFGVKVDKDSEESVAFSMPRELDRVILGYNELQKKQGLDLSKYTGKRVTRYTYLVTNYNADGEVYVNLFVYRNKIVAADVSSADPTGFVTPLLLVEPDSLK